MTENVPAIESAPDAEPPLVARLAEMRRTLAVAPLQGMYTAARVAIQVRTDSDTILEHLRAADDEFVMGRGDDELGVEGLVLTLNISAWLATRGEERRTAERRRADIRERAERAERVLGADDSRVRNRWEAYYLELGRETETYDEAVEKFRASLAARGWPQRMNFRVSLSSQNFATMLRRSSIDDDVAEGERITARNARWRSVHYGPSHPFTLVAEGNRILDVLYHLELAGDARSLTDDEQARSAEVLADARRLTGARISVLGSHHRGTVKAMSYQARAHRLLGQTDAARAIAQEAFVLCLAYSSKQDGTIVAILRTIIGEGYAAEADSAIANMRVAITAGSVLVADDERDRARSLKQSADIEFAAAAADFERWPNQAVWSRRVALSRGRLGD